MRKYRIVYNTLYYRVQWLGKTFFFRRPKWYWLRRKICDESYIVNFPSKEKAHEAIIQIKIEDYARKYGYIPIE